MDRAEITIYLNVDTKNNFLNLNHLVNLFTTNPLISILNFIGNNYNPRVEGNK